MRLQLHPRKDLIQQLQQITERTPSKQAFYHAPYIADSGVKLFSGGPTSSFSRISRLESTQTIPKPALTSLRMIKPDEELLRDLYKKIGKLDAREKETRLSKFSLQNRQEQMISKFMRHQSSSRLN